MIDEPITESNFLLIAMHHYDNSQCTNLAEFEEDLKRFSYLKKLFARYKESDDLKERLILNHIIILFNLFGLITVELLFFKIDKLYWDALTTFLVYLNLMPEEIPHMGINLTDIKLDNNILDKLRNI